jgi:hypothetical protein
MAYLEERIAQLIDKQISAKFKDQRLVSLETSDLILQRMTSQAKTYAWLAGIIVTLVLAGLTIVGLKTYHDFWTLVREAETQVRPKLEAAKQEATDAENAAHDAKQTAFQAKSEIDSASSEVRSELNKALGIDSQVRDLSNRVTDNGKRVTEIESRSQQVEQELARGLSRTSLLAQQTQSDLQFGLGSGALGLNLPIITRATLVVGPAISTVEGANFGDSPGQLDVEVQHGGNIAGLQAPATVQIGPPFQTWTNVSISFVLSDAQYQSIKHSQPKDDTSPAFSSTVNTPSIKPWTGYTELAVRVVTPDGRRSIGSPVISWPQ